MLTVNVRQVCRLVVALFVGVYCLPPFAGAPDPNSGFGIEMPSPKGERALPQGTDGAIRLLSPPLVFAAFGML